MPHSARKKSISGYYHVVPKGMHNQILFDSDNDRKLYIDLLYQAKKTYGLLIHAYCLMDNHVHLILEDSDDNLPGFMKFVNERYGMHLAESTGRSGGIFVRHLWSEPIEKESYLLCAVRYVHANPAAAGLSPASVYPWSSAKDYLGRRGVTDTDMVLNLLGGREGFIAWSKAGNSTFLPFPASRIGRHLSDEEMKRIASSIVGFDVDTLASMSIDKRANMVGLLVERGMPISTLSRFTGLGRKEIYHYITDERKRSPLEVEERVLTKPHGNYRGVY